MKIISAPNLNWSKRVTCTGCQAVLELEITDLKRVSGSDQREGSWDYVTWRCEICSTEHSSEAILSEMNSALKRLIRTK